MGSAAGRGRVTVGGGSAYHMTGPDGTVSRGWWRFLAVEPNRRGTAVNTAVADFDGDGRADRLIAFRMSDLRAAGFTYDVRSSSPLDPGTVEVETSDQSRVLLQQVLGDFAMAPLMLWPLGSGGEPHAARPDGPGAARQADGGGGSRGRPGRLAAPDTRARRPPCTGPGHRCFRPW